MKFKFCGELDAPDWLLREITIIAKVSSLRIKMIVKDILDSLLSGNPIDYEKLLKNVASANLTSSDVKALVAAITFILTNGAKYNVEPSILNDELQQLGLPKELADSLTNVFSTQKDAFRELLKTQVLQLEKLEKVDWRLDYNLATSELKNVDAPSITLRLQTSYIEKKSEAAGGDVDGGSVRKHNTYTFEMSDYKFRALLTELQTARAMMDTISS
eukprot:TRINITY_DN20683_c0_g1_i1.p1 TRINITY_DN20683_c0_g1~~TRINITY_DN20683_c0_g1_i1.p1  ORF type:complete len:216 (-),score=38.95 TRINITY_DN20683_c0_g1_i1:52-699(-)